MTRVTVAALSGILLTSSAAVALTNAEQKCVNALNNGMAKVAAAQLKADNKCVAGFAKGKNTDAVACYQNDTKVDTARSKTCDADTALCGPAPAFGYTGCGQTGGEAEFHAVELVPAVFGSPNTRITKCDANPAGCKCQGKVLKDTTTLYATFLKTYDECKKAALKNGANAVAALNACVSDDAKLKINKAVNKLGATVDKSCAGVTTPFSSGSCAGLTGGPLTGCLYYRVRCGVCTTEVGSDNLTLDCDSFDDNDSNDSCFDNF